MCMNVTKLELCTRVAKRLEKSQVPADDPEKYPEKFYVDSYKNSLELFIDEILAIIAEGHRIEIRGFGCFKPKTRRKRIGRNPRTGEIVSIPEYTAPYFKFSKEAQRVFEEKLLKEKSKDKK